MTKAIVFDCFGVILTDALSKIVADVEMRDPAAAAEIRAIIHAANRGIIDPIASTERVAELLKISVDEYRQLIKTNEIRNQPLLDYVQELRKDYKTALLSNITQQGIEKRFPNNELDQYFDVQVISSSVGYAKPEAQAYQITADRLGVELSECIFTDDREGYCDAARDTGMRAIHFRTLDQFRSELKELLTQA